MSIGFSLLSLDFPFETFKKSVDKKGFQLVSIYFQLMFLPTNLNLRRSNDFDRYPSTFN
jgi:hypothetical protein